MELKYTEAGSQQSTDFRNVYKKTPSLNINIEIKKTDSFTIKLNDTLPRSNVFYIILHTGKEYKRKEKENIPPQIIFIGGFDLIKNDIYYLVEYKKGIEYYKNQWGRKTYDKDNFANKLKYVSTYTRPNYTMNITHLLNSEQSVVLGVGAQHSQSV